MLNSAAPPPADPQALIASNVTYVKEFVANLLKTGFPHFTDNQIKITVQGLFDLNQDLSAFKEHIRDFLVQIKVRRTACPAPAPCRWRGRFRPSSRVVGGMVSVRGCWVAGD